MQHQGPLAQGPRRASWRRPTAARAGNSPSLSQHPLPPSPRNASLLATPARSLSRSICVRGGHRRPRPHIRLPAPTHTPEYVGPPARMHTRGYVHGPHPPARPARQDIHTRQDTSAQRPPRDGRRNGCRAPTARSGGCSAAKGREVPAGPGRAGPATGTAGSRICRPAGRAPRQLHSARVQGRPGVGRDRHMLPKEAAA